MGNKCGGQIEVKMRFGLDFLLTKLEIDAYGLG